MPTPANLLLILTDQFSIRFLSCYGNRYVATPNLQRLADRALTFDAAYCTSPVCLPARASLTTGRWHQSLGAAGNYFDLPTDVATLPDLLRPHGYVSGVFGKLHWRPYAWEYTRFDEAVDSAHLIQLALSGDDHPYNRAVAGHPGGDRRGSLPDFRRLLDPAEEYEPEVLAGVSPLADDVCPAAFLVDRTIDFMERHRRDRFFAYCSLLEPHHPYFPGERFAHVDPEAVRAVLREIAITDVPPHPAVAEDAAYIRARLGPQGMERVVAAYMGSVAELDHHVGRLLAHLERSGLAENTVVAFTADHGDLMGDFGLLFKDRMYESSVRVPFLLAHPGARPGRTAALASHLDLVPTALALAGAPPRPDLPGRSLLPLLADPRAPHHPAVYAVEHAIERGDARKIARWRLCGGDKSRFVPPRQELYRRAMVRRGDLKCAIAGFGETIERVELFDLASDPGERRDRAGDPALAGERDRLLADLHAFLSANPLRQPESSACTASSR